MPDLTQADSDTLCAEVKAVAQRIIEQTDAYVCRTIDPQTYEDNLATLAADLTALATTAADIAQYE